MKQDREITSLIDRFLGCSNPNNGLLTTYLEPTRETPSQVLKITKKWQDDTGLDPNCAAFCYAGMYRSVVLADFLKSTGYTLTNLNTRWVNDSKGHPVGEIKGAGDKELQYLRVEDDFLRVGKVFIDIAGVTLSSKWPSNISALESLIINLEQSRNNHLDAPARIIWINADEDEISEMFPESEIVKEETMREQQLRQRFEAGLT